jgi:hypothetical protein
MAPVLLACLVYGAVRLPLLAVAIIATIALHALAPHKELRFIFLATACAPILVGAGLGSALQRAPSLRPSAVGIPVTIMLALAIAGYTAVTTYRGATRPDDWHRDRAMLQATAAARAIPGVCGLGVRSIWVYRSGGYSYWRRDAPIYFETWERAQKLETTDFRLRLKSVLHGLPVAQYPDAELARHSDKFNVIIGKQTDGLPGFTEQSCYGAGVPDDPRFCVFSRLGACG